MGSREKILENILRARGDERALPPVRKNLTAMPDPMGTFQATLEKIGGRAVEVNGWDAISRYIQEHHSGLSRILSTVPDLPWFVPQLSDDPHAFENVDLAILKGHFGVAENGAVWITDNLMGDRSIPFISHHLALVINKKDIVPTLVEAYERLERYSYNYGTFIAGPSKTADIEQSLVLGAHGPKSMIVFLLSHG
jgi:L-lactate dehydrogenase complex protein LldG